MSRMTRLGKGLVIGNLVLSILMASWALGIYASQQMGADAGTKPAAGGGKAHNRAQAEVLDLQARVEAYKDRDPSKRSGLLTQAADRWQAAHDELVRQEVPYYANVPWYNTRLHETETGTGNLQTVSYENGQIVLEDSKNATSRPKLSPASDPPRKADQPAGEPLRSASFYRPKITEALDAYRKLSQQLSQLVTEDTALTEQLSGKPPATKGLWTRLHEEEAKQKQIRAEAEDLKDVWTKYQVDAAAVQLRQQQMQERAAELERKVGVKTARP